MTWASLRYIARRLLISVPVLAGVLVVAFLIGHVIPSNPLHLFVGPDADEAYIERMRDELHLDDPVWVQFYAYVSGLAKGDWGMSWNTRNTVNNELARRLPATFELITLSLLVCVVLAIPLGVLAAVKRDTVLDHVSRAVSLVGVSMPSFWFGLLLIYVFFYLLRIAPAPMGRLSIGITIRRVTGFYLIDAALARDWSSFVETLRYLALPVIAVAFTKMAELTRLVRSTMIEALNSDYIETSRAQGLRRRLIYYRLALKNAIVVPLTQIGILYGALVGGVVIIELVFAWPGCGSWAINAALAGDFAPVQAFAVICAATRLMIFLVVDIIYVIVDPRIRY